MTQRVAAGERGLRIVVAPDKFKGSLTAAEVASVLAQRLRQQLPGEDVTEGFIADGGEGTVDAAITAGFSPVEVRVTGPLGQPVWAVYAVKDRTAVIEMSAAAGLALAPSPPSPESAGHATTSGVGQMIAHALDRGASRIILGVGGSATTDGGAGMVAALGAVITTSSGSNLSGPGGAALAEATSIDLTGLDPRLMRTDIVLATDVDNPLLGPGGASRVYAPQKGADPPMVRLLEEALTSWADVVQTATNHDVRSEAGAGAAGGTGFAAMAMMGATVRPGSEVVSQLTGLDQLIAVADVVIVGEGSLDTQSLRGKGPIGLASQAARHGARVIAVVGRNELTADEVDGAHISKVFALSDREPRAEYSMANARSILEHVADDVAASIATDLGQASPTRAVQPLSAEEYRQALLSTVETDRPGS